jgi:hypothetical protein
MLKLIPESPSCLSGLNVLAGGRGSSAERSAAA